MGVVFVGGSMGFESFLSSTNDPIIASMSSSDILNSSNSGASRSSILSGFGLVLVGGACLGGGSETGLTGGGKSSVLTGRPLLAVFNMSSMVPTVLLYLLALELSPWASALFIASQYICSLSWIMVMSCDD